MYWKWKEKETINIDILQFQNIPGLLPLFVPSTAFSTFTVGESFASVVGVGCAGGMSWNGKIYVRFLSQCTRKH